MNQQFYFLLHSLQNEWTCVSAIVLRCPFKLFRTLLFPRMHYAKDILTQLSKKIGNRNKISLVKLARYSIFVSLYYHT